MHFHSKRSVSFLLLLAMLTISVAALLPTATLADGPATTDDIQNFGCQTLSNFAVSDVSTSLRFVFTVGSTDYSSAGFVFSKTVAAPTVGAAGCADYSTTKVYSAIRAGGELQNAGDGRYWVAVELQNIPRSYFDGSLYVRAFVVDGGVYKYSSSTIDTTVWGEHTTDSGVAKAVITRHWTNSNSGTKSYEKVQISEILGASKHFYPDSSNGYEGNDLLVEYSILWNESMLNFIGSNKPHITTRIANSSGGDANHIVYWSPVADNDDAACKFAGGFEYGTMRTSETGNPYPKMTEPAGDKYTDFPNIGGTDEEHPEWGWHRVQIRLHQEVTNEAAVKTGTAATYKCTTTIYIDGVLVSILSSTDIQSKNKTDHKLFTASGGGGDITYSDATAKTMYVHPLVFNSIQAKPDTVIDMAYSDLSVTCGQNFVMDVAKVNTPTAAKITLSGSEYSAKSYFVRTPSTPTVETWTPSSSGSPSFGKKQISAVLGASDHFYPDSSNDYQGNDLLVEYSILWNESMLNLLSGSNKPYITTRIAAEGGDDSNHIVYWSPVAGITGSDCEFAGGFEYGTMKTSEPGNPYPNMTPPDVGDSISDFPNIGGANLGAGEPQNYDQWGWHRVQIRLHQEVTNVDEVKTGTDATYKCTTTIYIDGVLVSILSSTDIKTEKSTDHKLFTASGGGGDITYSDATAKTMWVHPLVVHNAKAQTGKKVYFVYADISVTCGTDFVQKVSKVTSPDAATFTTSGGIELPANMYFKYDN